jgi:hypothetical protein
MALFVCGHDWNSSAYRIILLSNNIWQCHAIASFCGRGCIVLDELGHDLYSYANEWLERYQDGSRVNQCRDDGRCCW